MKPDEKKSLLAGQIKRARVCLKRGRLLSILYKVINLIDNIKNILFYMETEIQRYYSIATFNVVRGI